MTALLSPEIATLLARLGCVEGHKAGGRRFYLKHKKRIVTLGRGALRWLVPDWDQLSCFNKCKVFFDLRVLSLSFASGAFVWDLAILRDKESPKITLFSFKAGEKRISWLATADLHRNLEVDRFFRERGVSTLPLTLLDESQGLAGQPILPNAFSSHKNDLTPLDAQLFLCARENAVPDYIGTHYYGIEGTAASFGLQEACFKALITLEGRCGDWRKLVPLTIVHGDLTRWNVLRESDTGAWLIDFDRAFYASAFYDFIYAWIADGGYDRGQARQVTVSLAQALGFASDLPAARILEVGVALFILDNLIYLKHAQGQQSTYTFWLIHRAYSCLRAMENE
jgi:hypothetical protein